MSEQFSRTELILGKDALLKLKNSRVAVFGVGGVGGYVVEALARMGIGTFDLIDNDTISISNINRQIIATLKTVGRYKVDVFKERIHDICPDAVVNTYKCFFLPETSDQFDFLKYDYIIDAIDTVKGKLELVKCAKEANVKIISSMGTGNKLDPKQLEIADIYDTSVCPLARVMRYELRKMGIDSLKVIYSKEKPIETSKDIITEELPEGSSRRAIPGSVSFVPPAAGLIIASEVVKDLIS